MKKELLKLNLSLHEDPVDPVEPTVVTDPIEPEVDPIEPVKVEDIADDDKGFIAFMKSVFKREQEINLEPEDPKKDPEPDDQSALAIKYKNRYKEKYANQVNEANAAKDLSDLKLSIATAKADGRPFDTKYLDFVTQEINKSGKSPEEWLKEHPEYFEKAVQSTPVVKTNMRVNDKDKDYMDFLNRQRK